MRIVVVKVRKCANAAKTTIVRHMKEFGSGAEDVA